MPEKNSFYFQHHNQLQNVSIFKTKDNCQLKIDQVIAKYIQGQHAYDAVIMLDQKET